MGDLLELKKKRVSLPVTVVGSEQQPSNHCLQFPDLILSSFFFFNYILNQKIGKKNSFFDLCAQLLFYPLM